MDHQPMPVKGYTTQSQEKIDTVNANKQSEECILQVLDTAAKNSQFDQRWIAIARTHIEQGFMALNRAIFKPERIKL